MIGYYFLLLFGGVLGGIIVEKKYDFEIPVTGPEWNYECTNENKDILGVYDWKKGYPECKGYSQSPILMPTAFADMSFLDRLEYEGCWDNKFAWDLVNGEGKAVVLYVPDQVKIKPSVTTIAGKFLLRAIKFRVGKTSCKGSEHSMNGRLYPAEVQKFFYSDEYDSFWDAAKVPGKVAMISHLLETSEEDNPGFDGLLHNLHNINGTSKPYSLDWYAQVLFQEEGKKCSNCDYFFYEGSLSFPPCSEVALWFIMMKTIGISERQLNVLRSVLSSTTQEPMVCNSRLPQPANFRDILQHRELDFKSYDNYRPSPPPIMPPPGAYPPGMRPPPPGAYPLMMPPAYRQDPSGNSAGGHNAYPPQPYPSYPPPPYPNSYPFPTKSTPSPYYPDVTTESPSSYLHNPYHGEDVSTESPPSYPPNTYHDQYNPESPTSYHPNPFHDQYNPESPPSYPYQDQYPPHNRYPYPPPSHYPVPTTAAPYNPTTTEEPDYPHYNQPTPPERYYRHPTPPPYQPTTTKEATTTTATTTKTERPYNYPTTETPHPEYNPGTSTYEQEQYPTHEHNQYPRFNGQHRARG